MKDKEIQGMQIRICNACKQHKKCDKELCTMSELVAKELSRFYQPKLPEESVVLSREEYNKVDNIFKMSISDHIAYLRENERLKEDVQALIGTRFNRFNLITQEESDKQIQQVIKETAEKILTKLQPYIGGWVLFKELEKEYGIDVEIKEN